MADRRYLLMSQPGIRRDGTPFDSDFYSDGEWVRWQRGKPRKIGGYRAMSRLVNSPVREVYVDSRNDTNTAHYFSRWGVQRQQFSNTGAGDSFEDRTPFDFTPNAAYTWKADSMFSSTGSPYTALLAQCAPDVSDIASDIEGPIYFGDIATNDPLVQVTNASTPILTSGGICVLQPYLFVYGSNGLLRNSNANDFSDATGWVTGGANDANSANVSSTKFVHGAPVRGGGQSPAGIFWSLNAVVRASFTSDDRIWSYDTLSNPTSIMSKRCVVEVDGKFFWIGTDRFLMYNGVVQEIENNMNQNWFFDNLNYSQRNKVWGTKVPRWGEIWWFYPRGHDTECNDAIIFNYRENTWYDAQKTRGAGDFVETFPYPLWTGTEEVYNTTVLPVGLHLLTDAVTMSGDDTLSVPASTGVAVGMLVIHPSVAYGTLVQSTTATTIVMDANATAEVADGALVAFTTLDPPFVPGNVVTGGTSGAVGTAIRVSNLAINVINVTGTFVITEALTGIGGATGVVTAAPFAQVLEGAYQHEFGVNKVVGDNVSALRSSFTTCNFGFASGNEQNPFVNSPVASDIMTKVGRLDPDFGAVGPLEVTVSGRSYPVQSNTVLQAKMVQDTEPYSDFEAQERILVVKVESNVQDGTYQMGAPYVGLEPGDERSTAETL